MRHRAGRRRSRSSRSCPTGSTRGYAGEMHYLHRSAERRADVRAVMPSARSVIALGHRLQHRSPVLDRESRIRRRRADRALRVGRGLSRGHPAADGRARRLDARARRARRSRRAPTSTPGPVQERVYAQYAGLGWIGKNTCVINPEIGSWLFLSEIICSLPLEPDAPALDQCGTCRLCLDSCPTGAHRRSLRRRRDALPVVPDDRAEGRRSRSKIASRVGRHAYGCDICQEVCPWNAQPAAPDAPGSPWLPRARVRRPVDRGAVADAGHRAARVAEEAAR